MTQKAVQRALFPGTFDPMTQDISTWPREPRSSFRRS